MWEFSVEFYNKDYAILFKNSIEKYVKTSNGIITLLSINSLNKVLIAIPINVKKQIVELIKNKIAENILLIYKKKYILSNLNFNTSNNTKMNVFLKALVCFDSETDKDIIVNRLSEFNKKIVVESFINFKISFLKRKWNELIDLANDNCFYLTNEDTFNELIKFLISNLENRVDAVNLFNRDDCYFICDKNGRVIEDFLCDNAGKYDDEKLLTNLIALNPEKIIVHSESLFKDRFLNNLYELFSNRVEIYK